MARKPHSYKRSVSTPVKMDPGPYEAIVVSNLDPTHMGTLQVDLLKSNASGNIPERTGMIFEVKYLSPFYGITNKAGLKDTPGYEYSQSSYGMWMVPPDVGGRVLVLFVEGNSGQGFWFGCVQEAYMNFMLPGNASTRLTKSDDPDVPEALKEKKLPVSEYNKMRTSSQTSKNPSTFTKPIHKKFARALQEQGLIDDDIRGTSSSSARREAPSTVFGFSTPGPLDKKGPYVPQGPVDSRVNQPVTRLGGSSFVMDDGDDKFVRKGHPKDTPMEYINVELEGDTADAADLTLPHNDLVRIRTRTGHQILLHNTEDLIYIANSRGTAWLEFTSNGKIDIFCADSLSVHSENDINFTADRDINLTAAKDINMSAGSSNNQTSGGPLNISTSAPINYSTPENITITSNGGIAIAGKNAVTIVSQNEAVTVAGKSFSFAIEDDINLASNGNISIGAAGQLNLKASSDVAISASSFVHIKAEAGIHAQSKGSGIHIKSSEDIFIDAAADINALSGGSTFIESKAAINILASEVTSIEGSQVQLNPGGVAGAISADGAKTANSPTETVDHAAGLPTSGPTATGGSSSTNNNNTPFVGPR